MSEVRGTVVNTAQPLAAVKPGQDILSTSLSSSPVKCGSNSADVMRLRGV